MSPEQAQWLKDTADTRPPSVIVCAAARNRKSEILCSPRHSGDLWYEQIAQSKNPEDWRHGNIEQGFVDQFGQFFNRTEAWTIAEAAGQIIGNVGGDATDGGTLYSENLY